MKKIFVITVILYFGSLLIQIFVAVLMGVVCGFNSKCPQWAEDWITVTIILMPCVALLGVVAYRKNIWSRLKELFYDLDN